MKHPNQAHIFTSCCGKARQGCTRTEIGRVIWSAKAIKLIVGDAVMMHLTIDAEGEGGKRGETNMWYRYMVAMFAARQMVKYLTVKCVVYVRRM